MAAKLYYAYIALSRVFAEIFQKIFSPHSAHNPETRRIFVFHSARQKQGHFKLPPFAFALKMIFNLILKLNLKMNSNSKLVLNLILNLILNLKMFHVKHKLNHKKPIYGQKILLPRCSFVKNFFQKIFCRICRPSPKKKRLPEGSLA